MNALRRHPAWITLTTFVALYLACAVQFPFMLSGRVASNLVTDNAHLGVLAVGMTIVILSAASIFRSVRWSPSPACCSPS